MSDLPIRIVQISDIHLFGDKGGSLLGVKTQASFEAVLDLLKKDTNKPSLILITGDLSQDETETAYIRIADMISEFGIPVYCAPGNHDDSGVMKQIYPRKKMINDKHIILQNWDIIMLDSQKRGAVEGYLDASQLKYLKKCLEHDSKHHAIITLHHHPIQVGSAWLDNIGLKNADEFWKILKDYPRVNTILFGHVHQSVEHKKNDINCYAAPSTCIQFKKNNANFALDNVPPGYRWLDLYPDGRVKTGVHRVAHYIGEFHAHAKGY